MKAKEKAWQLYSNYFDIIENDKQEGELIDVHIKAVNAALYCVDEALINAPLDIMQDFDGTGEYYSVKAYYMHVKNEVLKLTTNVTKTKHICQQDTQHHQIDDCNANTSDAYPRNL